MVGLLFRGKDFGAASTWTRAATWFAKRRAKGAAWATALNTTGT